MPLLSPFAGGIIGTAASGGGRGSKRCTGEFHSPSGQFGFVAYAEIGDKTELIARIDGLGLQTVVRSPGFLLDNHLQGWSDL